MAERSVSLSYYYQTLDEEAKARYKVKLAMVGGMDDPYFTISGASSEDRPVIRIFRGGLHLGSTRGVAPQLICRPSGYKTK